MKFFHLVCASFLGAAIASPAVAGCTDSDLSGTWKLIAWSTDRSDLVWDSCTVTVPQGGSNISGTQCVHSNGKTHVFRKGVFNVASDCSVSGKFKAGKTSENFVHGQMNLDKASFSVVGISKIGRKTDGTFVVYATKQ